MGEQVTDTTAIEREDCTSKMPLQPGQRELGEIMSDQEMEESNSSVN